MNPRGLVVCVALLPACAVTLGEVNPAPNMLLVKSPLSIALRLAPEVKDAFEVPDDWSSRTMVTSWRATLANGFRNGYTQFFAKPAAGGKSDLTLVLRRADPSVVDAGRSVGSYAVSRLSAQVRFQAELLDANDQILKTWADTAIARKPANSGISEELNASVASAIEAMFEEIANGMPPLAAAAPAR